MSNITPPINFEGKTEEECQALMDQWNNQWKMSLIHPAIREWFEEKGYDINNITDEIMFELKLVFEKGPANK